MTSQQLASPRADRAAGTLATRRRQIASSWLVAAIVLLAFALRVVHLDFQSLWRDEVDAIRFATRPLPELLSTFGKPGENGPLFFLLLRPSGLVRVSLPCAFSPCCGACSACR